MRLYKWGTMRINPWLVVLFCLSWVLTACAPTAASIPTAVSTATPAPSATLTPTPAPTPTQQPTFDPYVLDLEKFHNFPESYEYLLAHQDEFVQAPDPFTDRAAFDQWFDDEFLLALGPVSEREVNLVDGPGYGGRDFRVSGIDSYKTLEPTAFFYFMDGDVVRPVVVENCGDQESRFVVTLAVVLFDHGNDFIGFGGLDQIQRIYEGYEIMTLLVYTALVDPNAPVVYENPPSFVFVERMLEAGFIGSYDDNRVIFGAGGIRTWDK